MISGPSAAGERTSPDSAGSSDVRRLSRRIFRTNRRSLLDRDIRSRGWVESGRVLAIGTGFDPYPQQFRRADQYIRTDVTKVDGITDLLMDGCAAAIRGDALDFVFLSEVLEHVIDPPLLIREVYRMLRPGGRVYLSVPFLYPVHGSGGDYWRFTRAGLGHLFRAFDQVEIVEHGSVLQSIADIVSVGSRHRAVAALRLITPLVSGIGKAQASLGNRAPVGYGLTARKPADVTSAMVTGHVGGAFTLPGAMGVR
jgi:SAM-dependent methyltransferase